MKPTREEEAVIARNNLAEQLEQAAMADSFAAWCFGRANYGLDRLGGGSSFATGGHFGGGNWLSGFGDEGFALRLPSEGGGRDGKNESGNGTAGETKDPVKMPSKKSWANMTDQEKVDLLYEPLSYINQQQKTTGYEWCFAISETENDDGTFTITAFNFRTDKKEGEVDIWYNNAPGKVVGDAHSHPSGSNDFSVGDIGGISNDIGNGSFFNQNGFTRMVVSGSNVHTMNVVNWNNYSKMMSGDFLKQNSNRGQESWRNVFPSNPKTLYEDWGLRYGKRNR